MNDTIKKIGFLFAAVAGAWYLLARPVKDIYVESETSNDVPWYLTYNYPPGFTGGMQSLIPSNLIGQANAPNNPGACTTCSIFPTVNNGRL